VVGLDTYGLFLLVTWHTWEERERTDRMFNAHTDTTLRRAFVPFPERFQPVTSLKLLNQALADMKRTIANARPKSLVYDD
jgi:hypothetical protein